MSGAIIIWQYQCMGAFHRAGATDASSAKTLAQIGCGDSFTFRCFVRNKVIVRTDNGGYYLDVVAADRFQRRQILAIFATGGLIILLLIWLRVL